MLQSRRFDSVLQRAKTPWPDIRGSRSLARAGLVSASLFALAACGQATEDETGVPETALEEQREVLVTAAFNGGQGDVAGLTFLPRESSPALGAVVAAPREGGIDLYDADGALRSQHAGARLTSIATAPGFQLRGENLPLIFGAAADGSGLRGYAVIMDEFTVLDLPLGQTESSENVAGLCLLEEGIGYVDLVILGTSASAEIWRINDAGDDTMSVTSTRQFPLPAPGRQCAAMDGQVYVLSPASGITSVDLDGNIAAEVSTAASGLTIGEFNGSQLVITTDGASAELYAFHARDLTPAASITVVDGLSTPGISAAGAISVTDHTYGYTAYSQGMLAVFDRGDQRVKVISREAFTRAYFTVE